MKRFLYMMAVFPLVCSCEKILPDLPAETEEEISVPEPAPEPEPEPEPETPVMPDLPGPPEGASVFRFTDRTMASLASGENFYCPVTGYSYSPYTLRFLDPFTYSSANPNGWSTSTANKTVSGPLLSDEEYRSVYPYIFFYSPSNAIYGPASKYSVMMLYSYDAMLFVNQLGTPAVNFRRLESSGASSDESKAASWVRDGLVVSISTAPDGTVTVSTAESSLNRNFKVDKTTQLYSASGTGRDTWKEGDVIIIQHLGRYGNVTDKEYLSTGFIHIKKIVSTGYDPSTGDFITSDSHASLTVDSYWENYLGI
ncbi:MAG: hypothetical protein ACI395_02685 [Candidatus Cryptobacteroides sp.]